MPALVQGNNQGFPILWNKFEAILNETFQTKYSAEGYKHGLASALPANYGTWTVIGSLQSEESLANLKLRD